MARLRVLAACEMSGRVRDAFAARNWEAWSADLLPSESPPYIEVHDQDSAVTDPEYTHHGNHYQGDVRDLFSDTHPVNHKRLDLWLTTRGVQGLWDLVIAFPPCTHLSLAGAVHWKAKRADGRQQAAANFFMQIVNAPAPHVAVENPRGDMTRRYRPPDQYVQPYMFGDKLTKLTGLWLENLPPLVPDNVVETEGRVATGGGSWRVDQAHGRGQKFSSGHEDGEGRSKRDIVRSRTLPGLARAMAEQWGSYVEENHDH